MEAVRIEAARRLVEDGNDEPKQVGSAAIPEIHFNRHRRVGWVKS